LKSFDEQVARYTVLFGPGAVLWAGKSKQGFCASMAEQNPNVAHFALVGDITARTGGEKKRRKTNML
jgi:hypothetical protein